MRASIILIFILVSLSLQGQKLISFPFLNRDELGSCPVCEIQDSNDLFFLRNFEQTLEVKFGSEAENQETYLRKIEFVESVLKQTSLTTAVRVKLLNTVIDWYCLKVIDNYDEDFEWGYQDSLYTVYNNSLASANKLINFSGPLKIIQLYDEILALPLDNQSMSYYRNLKLAYCAQSRIIKELNESNFDWIETGVLPPSLIGNEKIIAQNFLTTQKQTNYNPFISYNAISPGLNVSFGKEKWYGFQISYEPSVEINNPFIIRHPFLTYRTDYRAALFGIKLMLNQELSKKEFLFTFLDFQNTNFFYMNPFQFGWHLYGQNKLKMFGRPEFGIHYGIFTLSYGYNMTFDKKMRPFTEKHMVNFTISYPLFKIGSFY